MQIFLQEKSNFLKSNESFTEKFNKSCTEFEKLLLQSSGLFCVDLGCSNENFPSHEKNIKNRMDEKKNDIRPPLVGQASTSSNESSVDLHENNSSEDEATTKLGLVSSYGLRQRYHGTPLSSESSDKNSNDEIQIITQIPRDYTDRNYPIGCSNVTSADTSLELPDGRIPTPSSGK
ncbi:uncharacterized protein LOC103507371 isoform X1 [Diaphorina citri]|uniref:Uncharacterized protein LOC103507371 isoform X1 n=2 Tax=Diaphorina citri TaxID=121845 RepID=A0A3Q0ITQ9_DIACI|nr:uncharacterized protein LOC103507371 isoform X1 [Diaphorina citri]